MLWSHTSFLALILQSRFFLSKYLKTYTDIWTCIQPVYTLSRIRLSIQWLVQSSQSFRPHHVCKAEHRSNCSASASQYRPKNEISQQRPNKECHSHKSKFLWWICPMFGFLVFCSLVLTEYECEAYFIKLLSLDLIEYKIICFSDMSLMCS